MTKGKYLSSILLLMFLFFSCKKETFDKYERPEWLAGKVYSQIKEVENLKTFAQCLELTAYDTIINVSGSYTVFAPSDEAFEIYFSNHPTYKKIEDIPIKVLSNLVKYHIVQNPWSKDQLRSLDVNGWIDIDDEYNDKPRGYKRETLLLQSDNKFGVQSIDGDIDELFITDTTRSAWHRRVATDSRKFAPIFYKEYFNLYNLQLSDYTYYFDRSFDSPDDLFYVNAKIEGDEIFAENGFVYVIDRVVEPLPNANEILRSENDQYDYSKFLDLINQFPNFSYNEDKTFEQAGADQGLVVDSLFDLTYPQLTFDITSEKTKAPAGGAGLPEEVSIRFHHGLVAPTNEAFDEFIQQYVKGANQWGSLETMPDKVRRIITNTYFSINPIYDTDIRQGFYNGELDIVRLNGANIVQNIYGSNATFIGVNKAVVPRAFSSVTGPVYRQRGYSTMLNAIEFSGLLSALKRENQKIALFAVPDIILREDSSLFYNYAKINNITYESFEAIMLAPSGLHFGFNENDIRLLLLNQIAVELPSGIARKEYLRTIGGNHLIWDNENGTVQGTSPSIFGFNGGQTVNVFPEKISTDTDNGDTYSTNSWFKFSATEIYSLLLSNFPAFHNLLVKANLSLDKEYTYSFLSENKFYTIFAPSEEALAEVQADTLSGDNLKNFLKLHFIQDEMIFTDGKLTPAYYKTAATIKIPGTSRVENIEIYIEPDIDEIKIDDKNGNAFTSVYLSETSNRIGARSLSSNVDANFPNIMSTGVVHQIDKAFLLDLLDVK